MLTDFTQQETPEDILRELEDVYGDDLPDKKAVRMYLLDPERETDLNVRQRFLVLDKLLEHAEVSFRTSCDLIRYQLLREAGIVRSMDGFLGLFRSEDEGWLRCATRSPVGAVRPCV